MSKSRAFSHDLMIYLGIVAVVSLVLAFLIPYWTVILDLIPSKADKRISPRRREMQTQNKYSKNNRRQPPFVSVTDGENMDRNEALSVLRNSGIDSNNQQLMDRLIDEIMASDTSLSSLDKADPNLEGKIQATFDYYNPGNGVFWSWLKEKKSERRGALLEKLNNEQQLLIEQAQKFEQQVMQGKRQKMEYVVFMAKNISELMRIKMESEFAQTSYQEGMMPEDRSKANLEARLSEQRIQRQIQESESKIKYEEKIAGIKNRQAEEERMYQERREERRLAHEMEKMKFEHEQAMEKIRQEHFLKMQEAQSKTSQELQDDIQWSRERIKMTIEADQMQSQQKAILLQNMIDMIYQEIAGIKQNDLLDEETKQKMIADREDIIRGFKESRFL